MNINNPISLTFNVELECNHLSTRLSSKELCNDTSACDDQSIWTGCTIDMLNGQLS